MSDDEADLELLELLRQSLGLTNPPKDEISSDTGVLKDAEYVYDNAIDVSIDMYGTKAAAASIYSAMKERGYSTEVWSQQELHPTTAQGFSDVDIVNFIFTTDLLNFSFWSELPESERFHVEYKDRRWTGYKSLLACLKRALDEDVPITTPRYWNDPACSDEMLKHIFRSATNEEMPLLSQRIAILREAGQVLQESFDDLEVDLEQIDNTPTFHEIKADVQAEEDPVPIKPTLELTGEDTRSLGSGAIGVDTAEDAELPASQNVPVSEISDMDVVEPTQERPQSKPTVEPETSPQQEIDEPPSLHTKIHSKPDLSIIRVIEKADQSAGKLVNILVKYFPSFRDETRFNGRKVRFFKRAQIFVADLWAAFNGTDYGAFDDIGHLTMFAGMLEYMFCSTRAEIAAMLSNGCLDYRVPQMLNSIGVLVYSPPLHYAISDKRELQPGDRPVQTDLTASRAVELIRREILKAHPEALNINAVLIDFFLYDLAKEREALGVQPHHHTRSIYY